jgi:glycosyltransferase involved in cell wall biosynthesis
MRVTFLLPKYGWQPSGGFSVVYTYAGMLAQRGHDVVVVHPRRLPRGGWPAAHGVVPRLRRAAARVRDVLRDADAGWAGVDPRVRMKYVPELSARHVPDADAVIATWWATAEAALLLPREKGVRLYLVQGYETWGGAADRVDATWRAPLHKVVIAEWLKQRAVELGVPASDVTHIPNAIDHACFRLERPIAARRARVAMLYAPHPYKGGDIGLEMLKRVKSRVPGLEAVLFGIVPRPAGAAEWMQYERNVDGARLRTLFNDCAVYLCPSLSEGWHLPPAEAMACGCAVAGSDIGGIRDYAVHDETALLFEPGSVEAGSAAVERLLRDDVLRQRLAASGLARIAGFSWERSTVALEALLNRLAQ